VATNVWWRSQPGSSAMSPYLETERPADAGTEQLFVVLKRPRRGQPLTAAGLDEVLRGPGTGRVWPMPPATSCGTPA
jgi:hypothetical protein